MCCVSDRLSIAAIRLIISTESDYLGRIVYSHSRPAPSCIAPAEIKVQKTKARPSCCFLSYMHETMKDHFQKHLLFRPALSVLHHPSSRSAHCSLHATLQLGQGLLASLRRRRHESSPDEPGDIQADQILGDTRGRLEPVARRESLRVGVIKLGRLGRCRQVIQDKVEKGEQGIVLCLQDVVFKFGSPLDVLGSLNLVAERGQRTEEIVVPDRGVTGNVSDLESLAAQRRGGRKSRKESDVVDRSGVDRVVDIRDETQLETPLDHSPNEIVRVGYYRQRMQSKDT